MLGSNYSDGPFIPTDGAIIKYTPVFVQISLSESALAIEKICSHVNPGVSMLTVYKNIECLQCQGWPRCGMGSTAQISQHLEMPGILALMWNSPVS